VLLIGHTGVGKTFFAQAIGLHACACVSGEGYRGVKARKLASKKKDRAVQPPALPGTGLRWAGGAA